MTAARKWEPSFVPWTELERKVENYRERLRDDCSKLKPPYIGYCYTSESLGIGCASAFLGPAIAPETKYAVHDVSRGSSSIRPWREAQNYVNRSGFKVMLHGNRTEPKMKPCPARVVSAIEKDIERLRKQGRLLMVIRCSEDGSKMQEIVDGYRWL